MKGVALLLLVNLYSCTDYNYIDGGLANGVHDCTMWQYFENQTVDWDSTMLMIEHAGMKSCFDGSGQYKQITFFGITDIAIARFTVPISVPCVVINDGLMVSKNILAET